MLWVPMYYSIYVVPVYNLVGICCNPQVYNFTCCSFPATFPRGDILLKEGETLEVNCTIDRSSSKLKGLTSKDIRFEFSKHEIPDDRLQTTILDDSTVRLRVENMNASTPLLHCFVRPVNRTRINICQNQVEVGCKFHLITEYFFYFTFILLIHFG